MADRLDELLLAWEDGSLDDADVTELIALLANDPAARAAMTRHFVLSMELREQLEEACREERVVRELQRMVRRDAQSSAGHPMTRLRLSLAMAVAAVLLISVVAGWRLELPVRLARWANLARQEPERELRPAIVAARGDIRILDEHGQQADSAATIGPGWQIRTGRNSYVLLRYSEGTSVQLPGETLLVVEPNPKAIHLTLHSGGLYAEVAPQPADHPLIVNPNRRDRVEVVGTRFEVERAAGVSAVRVAEGKVRFGTGGHAVVVSAHEESTSVRDQLPTAPKPVAATEIWQGWQHGLLGAYYDQRGFDAEPVLVRIDPRLDFHWETSSPDPSLQGPFRVRWIGEIEVPRTDEYTFHIVAHYGVRIWVNGRSLINSAASMGGEETTTPVHLEKGKRYPIKIEYHASRSNAKMRFLWSSPAMPLTVVDQQWLYPAAGVDE